MSSNEEASEERRASAEAEERQSTLAGRVRCGLPFFLYFKWSLFFPFLLIQRVSQTAL